MKKLAIFLVGLTIVLSGLAQAGPVRKYDVELLAKAKPDECFHGIGNPNNIYPFPYDDFCSQCIENSEPNGRPKTNQAYVWGLTKSGDSIWFGTAPNPLCVVMSAYLGASGPMQNESYSCEFDQSQYSPQPELGGDWRPPEIWVYDTATK